MPNKLVLYPSKNLSLPSFPLDEISDYVHDLSDRMFQLMYQENGIGLAAPQIGINIRLFVYDFNGQKGIVLNPRLKYTDQRWIFQEGCLSIPNISFPISRYKTVTMDYMGIDGHQQKVEATNTMSQLFQHETDHLNGELYIQKLTKGQRIIFDKEYDG